MALRSLTVPLPATPSTSSSHPAPTSAPTGPPGGRGLVDSDAAKNRREVKPPVNRFCDLTDQCFPGLHFTGTASEVYGANAGPCAHKNAAGQYDLKCWYHQSSRWKSDCVSTCGQEFIRFVPGYEYQADGKSVPA